MVPSFETNLRDPTVGESLGFIDNPWLEPNCHRRATLLFRSGTKHGESFRACGGPRARLWILTIS